VAERTSFEQEAIVQATASNLRIDAATAEVIQGLEVAGVPSLLLKGPALSAWYADDRTRAYVDCDLWVRPSDLGAAERIFAGLGFRRYLDERGLPPWWLDHATAWVRDADGVQVDLHRVLQGVGVDAETAWRTLSATADTVVVAGHPAPVLSVPARALYVTLHAATHGQAWGKALVHVERALSAVDESDWKEAASLAEQLDAADAFASGLRLVPEGAALARRLRLPATQSVKVALHASTPPPIALGFEQLSSANGLRERITIIARKAVPPPGFMRHWWPPAARNRRMLALAYVYRPLWLLRHAPRGLRAWSKARRSVHRG
jgi:hypothetical protein